jgi:AraC-like DNA-binding protein
MIGAGRKQLSVHALARLEGMRSRTMTVAYCEWQPPAALADRVRCVWRLRDQAPDGAAQTIYPDGCCELIVHLGTPMQRWREGNGWQPQAACLFAAQQRSAIRLRAVGQLDCVGMRLQPWCSAIAAGTRLPDLRDDVVDLRELAPALADALSCWLPRVEADSVVEWAELDRALGPCAVPLALCRAAKGLEQCAGNARIDALAQACGLPMRTLQAQFLRWVGLSAKEYARLLRLQATLRALDAGVGDIAALSLDRGFSDQAHATRELQRLTGLPPARLLRALRANREGAGAIALAAAFVRGRG